MKKLPITLLIFFLAFLVFACEGGTSGSVSGSGQSCTSNGSGGVCEGSYAKLSGTYSEDIEVSGVTDEVLVDVTASVDEGSVRVYLVDPDGNKTGAVAKPGAPVSVSGSAEVSLDAFSVYFEAVDGKAAGVKYNIQYTYP